MRRRIALSLICSALLIFGAVWFRISHEPKAPKAAPLAVVPTTGVNSNVASADETKLEAIYNGTSDIAPRASTTDTALTDTDLISRQMLSDYVSLSANGQATPDNLDALGDEYATNIVSINKASSILATDLTTVANSRQNLQAYADGFIAIYKKYLALETVEAQGVTPSSNADTDTATFDPGSASFAKSMGALYQSEATNLKALPVPDALVVDHTEIVNRYLRDAWDMNAISNLNNDPTDAYAALASQNSAGDDEQNILSDIDRILTANGIIAQSS